MNIKDINYKELVKLLDRDYAFIVIDELSDEYEKDINALTNFFKETKAVSDDFKFDEMYIYDNDDKKSLVISLEQDEYKLTNLPYVHIAMLMQGIKIYWLSDFIDDLNYSGFDKSEDLKI